jgi:hypothetical protein
VVFAIPVIGYVDDHVAVDFLHARERGMSSAQFTLGRFSSSDIEGRPFKEGCHGIYRGIR